MGSVKQLAVVFGKGEGSGREGRSWGEGRGWSQWREREEEGESCVAGCDTLAAIYESMYGKAHMHMTAREEVISLPGDVEWEERMAAVVLFIELHKKLVLD